MLTSVDRQKDVRARQGHNYRADWAARAPTGPGGGTGESQNIAQRIAIGTHVDAQAENFKTFSLN
eukprot:7899896-Pyramimonas_sp.AAC.1